MNVPPKSQLSFAFCRFAERAVLLPSSSLFSLSDEQSAPSEKVRLKDGSAGHEVFILLSVRMSDSTPSDLIVHLLVPFGSGATAETQTFSSNRKHSFPLFVVVLYTWLVSYKLLSV